MKLRIQIVEVLFLLNFCLLSITSIQAKETGLKFERITVDQGLPDNTILSIFQDRLGFLWFGTRDGLCKYDGLSFQNFKNDMLQVKSAYDNYVYVIYENQEGNFWLGTAGELYLFNPNSGKFTGFGLDMIFGIIEDKYSNLWVGTWKDGLFKLDGRSGELQDYSAQLFNGTDTMPLLAPMSMRIDSEGMIWVGTEEHGLFRFNPETYKSKQYVSDSSGKIRLDDVPISAIQIGRNGKLWIGTHGAGLKQFDTKTEEINHYYKNPLNLNCLSDDTVRVIYFDSDENILWIGTEKGGLNKFDPATEKFTIYKHDSSNPASLSFDGVWSIFKDRSGIMWIGTRRGGVNKFNPQKIVFNHFNYKANSKNGLKYNTIWSIYEDSNKNIWVGAQGGLFQLQMNVVTGERELIPWLWNSSNYENYFQYPVRDFCEDKFGFLWMGLLSGGIVQLNKATNEIRSFRHDKKDSTSLCSDHVYTVYMDLEDNIWIGSNIGGLTRLDREQGEVYKFSNFSYSPKKKGEYTGWVITIRESRRWLPGFLWIGSWQQGLFLFDKKKSDFISFQHEAGKSNSLSNNTVVTIYEDRKGRIWLGTYGGGLNKIIFPDSTILTKNRFDQDQIKFKYYMEKDGLCNNIVYNILEDDFGNLWLGTNNGLSKFNPETEQFVNYFLEDGLPGNGFNLGANYKSWTGELYFGGDYGVTGFYPNNEMNTSSPEVVLTSFKKLGQPVYFDSDLNKLEAIELQHNENFFSFEFGALHFADPPKNVCAFKLEGYDKEWNYVGPKGEAKYKNVSPGKYRFIIKASNCDGVWGEKKTSIYIIIHQPFWKSWWFILLTSFLFLLSIFSFHRFRLRQAVKYEQDRLEEQEKLRERIVANFHDELGHRITKISLMSKILRQQKGITEISDANQVYLKQIADNADSLFKDMRECIWELDPKKESIYDLAVHLKDFSDQLFDQTEIAFQLVIKSEKIEKIKLPAEWRRQLLRIFKEGMTNIIKHAHGCKNVRLEFILKDSIFQITLSNDGSGFDQKNCASGNGLQNIRKRAEKITGKLQIISEKLSGTKIVFTGKLP